MFKNEDVDIDNYQFWLSKWKRVRQMCCHLPFPLVRHHSATSLPLPLRLVSRQPCGSAARSFSMLARRLVAVRWRPWKRNKKRNKHWRRPSRQFEKKTTPTSAASQQRAKSAGEKKWWLLALSSCLHFLSRHLSTSLWEHRRIFNHNIVAFTGWYDTWLKDCCCTWYRADSAIVS